MNPCLIDKLQLLIHSWNILNAYFTQIPIQEKLPSAQAEWDTSLSSESSESNNPQASPKGRQTNTKQSDKIQNIK